MAMSLLLTNPPKRRKRKNCTKKTITHRRRRPRTLRSRQPAAHPKGLRKTMRKRSTRRRHSAHPVARRRRIVSRGGFARSGFINKDLLISAGAATAGFMVPDLLLTKLASNATVSNVLFVNGDVNQPTWAFVAAKAGLGLLAGFLLRKRAAKIATFLTVGAVSSAAMTGIRLVQAKRALGGAPTSSAAMLSSQTQPALTSGVAGYETGGMGAYARVPEYAGY